MNFMKDINKNIFLMLFILFFVTVNTGYYYFLFLHPSLSMLLYIWILEFIAFGIAYELTELILSIVLPQSPIPRLKNVDDHPPVALVCCVCDDVDPDILRNLKNQTYPNIDVFILDDSQQQNSRTQVDLLGFKTIRRQNRQGYKAGNLNNWLYKYGSNFKYFVVADADSIMPPEFIEEMVRYGEHQDNRNVAIFESIILPWNCSNDFVRYQSITKPIERQNYLRLYNRFDLMFSYGHNNLYCTSAILAIGGFNENYIAEDFATTLDILREKKGVCKCVPVVSYERLPENLFEYARREARWAYQTFQLLSIKISGLSWHVQLRILQTLHYHFSPIVALSGMLLLIFLNIKSWFLYPPFSKNNILVSFIKSRFFLFWFLFLIFPIMLRLILIFREKILLKDYIRSTIFHSAIFTATIWPVLVRLSRFITGDRLGFNVTGKSPYPSLLQILKIGNIGFILSWICLLSLMLNPIYASLNLIWIIPACLSPFIIYRYQKKDMYLNVD